MQWRGVRRLSVRPSVRLSVCKLLRKSLLLADKWLDRHQTCTRWTPGQRASMLCSRSRSRSKATWYAHFLGFLEWATPSLTVWLFLQVLYLINYWNAARARWYFLTAFRDVGLYFSSRSRDRSTVCRSVNSMRHYNRHALPIHTPLRYFSLEL